jgi:hypothetical protein
MMRRALTFNLFQSNVNVALGASDWDCKDGSQWPKTSNQIILMFRENERILNSFTVTLLPGLNAIPT